MSIREDTIAWNMSYCQHYDPNGITMIQGKPPTGVCKTGVNFNETFGSEPGIFKRIPCTSGNKKSHEELCAMCPKWLQNTREQSEERADQQEAREKSFTLVMPVVATWRTWTPDNRVAKVGVIECPVCKSHLHLSQSSFNGHVHGQCETKGCVSWME